MRRPVKYKAKQAERNRRIIIAAAAILGVIIIGGTSAAVILNRSEPTGKLVKDSDTVAIQDTNTTKDDQHTQPADTKGEDISDTTAANGVTEPISDDTTAPQDTTVASNDTDVPPAVTDDSPVPAVTDTPDVVPPETDVQNPPDTEKPTNVGTPTDVGTVTNYKGGYLALSEYPTASALKDAAEALRASGYTAVMVELKYDNGKLAYQSNVAQAKEYGANPSVAALSLDDIVSVLHQAGLYVTGRVCALRDDLAAKGNTEMALMNTAGFRYSDGASRWISVYSQDGQDYILSLLSEMQDAGVDEIMLRDYALPADTGTTAPAYDKTVSKTDAVKAFVSRVNQTLTDTALNLEMDVSTIAAGGSEIQGMECAVLSTLCDSLSADITLSNLPDGLKIGNTVIADADADPKKTVETILSALDTQDMTIRPLLELTGNTDIDQAQVNAAQGKGYEAYQMIARVVKMNEK